MKKIVALIMVSFVVVSMFLVITPTFAETRSISISIRVKTATYGDGTIKTLDLESEYLPVVIACENPDAPYESMKAQAVVSRTFALYKINYEPRSNEFDVYDDERDQVYNPTVTVTDQYKQSVKDTNGIVLRYAGEIICAFFVSGRNIPGVDETYKFVTDNEGKTGNDIDRAQKPIGDPANPHNRGCMGQIQANELAFKKDYKFQWILRYFYGADIEGLPIEIPFKAQVPPGTWDKTKNCGQASSLMAFCYYWNTQPTEEDIKRIDEWLNEKYGDPINNYNGWYTTTAKLEALSREYAKLPCSYSTNGWNLNRLKQEIDRGHPVIVAITAGKIPYRESTDPEVIHYRNYKWEGGHFVVVKGYTSDCIICNDPGTSLGESKYYFNDDFEAAMNDQSGAVVVPIFKIIFEDAHDTDNDELLGRDANYHKLKGVLENKGYVVEELNIGPITESTLGDCNILILPDVELELSAAEVRAMVNYLNDGGRILVVGEWKGAHLPESVSKVSQIMGMKFENTIVYDPDNNAAPWGYAISDYPVIHNIDTTHPIGKDISNFAMYAGSSLLLTSDKAKAIAWGDDNTYTQDPFEDEIFPDNNVTILENPSELHNSTIITLAASKYSVAGGEARLVCIGDSDLWKTISWEWSNYDPIENYDNKKLFLNVINWLVTPVPPPLTPQPGFGMISQGEVTTSGIRVIEGAPELRVELNWLGSDLDLGVEDPLGRYVGYNPETGQVEIEIPGAEYSGLNAKPEWVRVSDPEPGDWIVNVYGREITEEYELYRVDVPDTIPPTTLLTIGEPKYVTDITYVTPDTPFNLTATDNPGGTGVALTAYKIRNATYNSGWLTYTETFYLTELTDGVYTIDYNSTDNANNVEPTNTINVTLFSWNYVFTDSYGRETSLKINTEHHFFQFITPDNDY